MIPHPRSRARRSGGHARDRDRGNRLVLDAYRDVFADDPAALRAARWRIEHAQVLAGDDIPLCRDGRDRFDAALARDQRSALCAGAPWRGALASAYAWRSLTEGGAVLAAGSDAPVEKGDPLIEFTPPPCAAILAALPARLAQRGSALRAEALKALTWAPAFATFQEGDRGVLEAGKRLMSVCFPPT